MWNLQVAGKPQWMGIHLNCCTTRHLGWGECENKTSGICLRLEWPRLLFWDNYEIWEGKEVLSLLGFKNAWKRIRLCSLCPFLKLQTWLGGLTGKREKLGSGPMIYVTPYLWSVSMWFINIVSDAAREVNPITVDYSTNCGEKKLWQYRSAQSDDPRTAHRSWKL